ncbi:uncharacterized protein LOC112567524 isoform X2 [Pomacea canaliculata]|uniref:uncharacterized protein LOC112567524 isoform X2 n=1 Tax=Pomacea canaliculata TaxID=400727 RepID=UPI000D732360|nr:uncharacterized protein LOC112567524 isoform X2 [Pomacea canaliculata]
MTAPMAVVGLALITAFPASVSIPALQGVEVKKISSNSFLVLWKKPENVSLETWKNFTYYLRISPKKTTSPVVEYVLDTEGNSTWKEFCLQEADATLQITYCQGRQCENTSVLRNISFTEESNWFSELKIILSQKQPYVAIGAGIALAISLFVAVIFICCRYKRTSGSLNKRDSNFSLDSETNVQAVQFTERGRAWIVLRLHRSPSAPRRRLLSPTLLMSRREAARRRSSQVVLSRCLRTHFVLFLLHPQTSAPAASSRTRLMSPPEQRSLTKRHLRSCQQNRTRTLSSPPCRACPTPPRRGKRLQLRPRPRWTVWRPVHLQTCLGFLPPLCRVQLAPSTRKTFLTAWTGDRLLPCRPRLRRRHHCRRGRLGSLCHV